MSFSSLKQEKTEETENQWLFLDWSECEDAEQKAKWTEYKHCSQVLRKNKVVSPRGRG